MKLRNKKTGEIVDLTEGFIKDSYNGSMIQIKPVAINNKEGYLYGSLAELNAEWEDMPEEPKKYWYIDIDGEITYGVTGNVIDQDMQRIGNYFETKEEAEKAVEKLKAWKRLRDKGMIKYSFSREKRGIDLDFYTLTILAPRDEDSLKLLFGGEE